MSEGSDSIRQLKPRLRPIEAHPERSNGDIMVMLRDPLGVMPGVVSVSPAAISMMGLMDGTRSLDEIRDAFEKMSGQALPLTTLQEFHRNLDDALLLEGENFERQYRLRLDAYRQQPTRKMYCQDVLESEAGESNPLDSMLGSLPTTPATGRMTGIIAPHLDYDRGMPCYRSAYASLLSQSGFRRFVILGTNHHGRSSSVVSTGKDFDTPLGTVPVDRVFLENLENRCGVNLRTHELDHAREHSVELQALLLKHLLPTDDFAIVPFLCPNPCGPTGTRPFDGQGMDLGAFGLSLSELLGDDPVRTCVIAGADLSHVGAYFGDTVALSDAMLELVRLRDEQVLQHVAKNDPAGFLEEVSGQGNPTRICSAGCIYALMTALPGSQATVLDYHQATNDGSQCCVSCASVVFMEK